MTAIVSRFPESKRVRTVPRSGPKNRARQARFCAGLAVCVVLACVPVGLFIWAWNVAQSGGFPRIPQHVEAAR